MAQETWGRGNENWTRVGGVNVDNVVADEFYLPEAGWLRKINMVRAGGADQTTYARFCIWDETGKLVWAGNQQTWDARLISRHSDIAGVRRPRGTKYYAGFWRHPAYPCVWTAQKNHGTHFAQSAVTPLAPPNLNPAVEYEHGLSIHGVWIRNRPPSTGAWRTPPTPNGAIGNNNPTFSGTMPHPGEEEGWDYSTRVQVQVYRSDNNALVADVDFEPSAAELDQGYFERSVFNHAAGVSYYAIFRHQDSWGLWSLWSGRTTYVTNVGPGKAVPVSPTGRLATGTGFNYVADYSHANALAANAAQVQVFDEKGNVRLFDSGTLTVSVANNGRATIASTSVHGTLPEGRRYRFHIRFRDSAGVWGAYSDKIPYFINAKPYVPSNLQPTGGQITSDTVLRCQVSDPDEDRITQAVARVYRSSDNVLVGSYAMTIAQDGKTATVDLSGTLVLSTGYKWQAQANDGLVWSEWSSLQSFTYAQAPAITLRSPSPSGIINLMPQPSAEYDPAEVGSFWTEAGRTATSYIDRVVDADAAFGLASWEATTSGDPGHYLYSNPINVDATKHYFFTAGIKRINGSPRTVVRLACYSGTGTFLGSVAPTSRKAIPTTPDPVWTRYGGEIWNSASAEAIRFPVGTSYIRVEWFPSNQLSSSGVVRLDAVLFSQPNTANSAAWLLSQPFWGYFDGDTAGYGPFYDRTWDGTPGNSTSRGPSILTEPSAYVEFAYNSPGGSAKVDDRIIVERWSGNAWVTVYTTQYATNGARTQIPLPTSVVRNQGRYRVTVYAKDSLGLIGNTPAVEFDVSYEGPGELPIVQIAGSREKGTLTVYFIPSALEPLEFGGIEVLVSQRDGSEKTYYINDVEADRFVYHYPESNFDHRFRLRQVQLIGNEQLESRWVEGRAAVNYFPIFFLKNVHQPDATAVSFYVMHGERPSYKPKRFVTEYPTWHSRKPKHAVGAPRYDEGSITMHLFDADEFADSGEDKLAMVERMEEEMGTYCLLSHKPSRKRFIQLKDGPDHSISDSEDYVVALSYSETQWEEDAVQRGERIGEELEEMVT